VLTETIPQLPSIFAALCTPTDECGRPDLAAFDRVVDFVMERGAEGIVLGGATAEFPHFTVEDRSALIRRAVARISGRGPVLANVGTSSVFSTVELAHRAADARCAALLLSMPHYFRYSQDDLAAYCEGVCASVDAPFLLYNLPSFATPIEVSTALRLFESIPNLVGIKDSSGNAANLAMLAASSVRQGLFAGHDSLLLDALRAGWSGVISGIACFAPELVSALVRSYHDGDQERVSDHQTTLNQLVEKVAGPLPTPWGIRIGLEARGIATGPLHIPLARARRAQIDEIRNWLADWTARQPRP
jgi:dihydrodipicolinate synthase/N-acetylneuraminate lyase